VVLLSKNPWGEFEHRMRNAFPQNPTQTDYIRFQQTQFETLKTPFDTMIEPFETGQKAVFKTHYLDILEKDNGWN
jgi:hypothetical protein